MRIKCEDETRDKDLYLERLLSKSLEIKNKIVTIDEKKQKKGGMFSQAHLGEMMSELEHMITKLMVDCKGDNG